MRQKVILVSFCAVLSLSILIYDHTALMGIPILVFFGSLMYLWYCLMEWTNRKVMANAEQADELHQHIDLFFDEEQQVPVATQGEVVFTQHEFLTMLTYDDTDIYGGNEPEDVCLIGLQLMANGSIRLMWKHDDYMDPVEDILT